MKKDRVTIPQELADRVTFAADRTCCVCRQPHRKFQIHHIDEDPSNNVFSNLATLCGDCHSDAHTTQSFARNLTPGAITLFNNSWRDIVLARLTMPLPELADKVEYSAQVLQEIRWNCGIWLNRLLHLVPEKFYPDQVNSAPWETIIEVGFPEYTPENYKRYAPLFTKHVGEIADRLEKIVATFGDALPIAVKLSVFRVTKWIRIEAIAYRCLPATLKGEPNGHFNNYFRRRFIDTSQPLQDLSNLTELHRKKLFPEPDRDGEGVPLFFLAS